MAKTVTDSRRNQRKNSGKAKDDCFSCAKRGIQCGRQRPYCSQCLVDRIQCSGYQISLTWGVGIASRGKLRGQACPVPQSGQYSTRPNRDEGQLPVNVPKLAETVNTLEAASSVILPQPTDLIHSNTTTNFSNKFPEDRFESEAEQSLDKSILRERAPSTSLSQFTSRSLSISEPSQSSITESVRKSFECETRWGDIAISVDSNESGTAAEIPQVATELSPTLLQTYPGKTLRERYLTWYFIKRIAPTLVAFNHIPNPYSTFILAMAYESDMLQNVLVAIAAAHIRQAPCQLIAETSARNSNGPLLEDAMSPENLIYRARAVQELNARLAEPSQHCEDDVLTTFLFLVIYDLCKTGIAKLESQILAARKILDLRQRENKGYSRVTRFCTQVFAWIDTLTSVVHCRSGYLRNEHLDIAWQDDGYWSLDNTTGCNRLIFQEIAQLSQFRAGFDDFGEHSETAISGGTLLEEIRCRLTTCKFFSNTAARDSLVQFLSSTSGALSTYSTLEDRPEAVVSDIEHISNLFRNASLIHCQRIAFPDFPSTDRYIQLLVARALRSIESIQSTSHILWPLLIVGCECTYNEQQNAIRQKLQDIYRFSGFAIHRHSLDILENLWTIQDMESFDLFSMVPMLDQNYENADFMDNGNYNRIGSERLPRNGWTIWRSLNENNEPGHECAVF